MSHLRLLLQVLPKNRMGILVNLILFFLLLRGDLEGLLGSVAQGLKVENPCFGIIICVLMEVAGLVVIATDMEIIHLTFSAPPPAPPLGFDPGKTSPFLLCLWDQ